MLRVPEASEIDRVASGIKDLSTIHADASAAAGSAGTRCTCEVADSLGLRELVLACGSRETQSGCEVGRLQPAVRRALKPIVDAVGRTPPPLLHWRIVGKTDRPGWLAEHESDIVQRHPGGSTFYVRGQTVPARYNHELIKALLQVEGVTAVVRQDGGRGLLVVREIEKELVLDHFAYAAVDAEHMPLLSALDNAHADHYIARLAKPSSRRDLEFVPQDGNLIEVDRLLLEEVDRFIIAAAPLGGGYDTTRERRSEPDAFVDRVSIQAPFGKQGTVLRVRLQLSSAGQGWANALSDDVLSPTLDELDLAEVSPTFVPPPGAADFAFVLRGTLTNEHLLHGLHNAPTLMRQVEMSFPNTVRGKASAWEFNMPPDDLSRFTSKEAPAAGLRKALFDKAYEVEVGFDNARTEMSAEFRPR